jgi:hypothetical protein
MLLEEYLLVRRRDELRLEKGNHNGGPLSLHDKARLVERALADEEGTSHSVTQPLLPPPQRSDHEGTDNKKKYGSLFK